MFIFIPKIGGNDPIWRSYFSHGLVQPPTSFPWWWLWYWDIYIHTNVMMFFLEILLGDTHGDFDEIWGITHMIWLKPQKIDLWWLVFFGFFNHLEIKFRSPKLKCFFRKTCLETWIDHGPFWDSWFDESWNSTGLTQTTLVPGMAGGSWCM